MTGYTREQILSMCGDELENTAAEVVCGWTLATDDIGVLWWKDENGENMSLEVLFQPSSDRNAAMELEDKVCTTHENTMRYVLELTKVMNLGSNRNLSYLAKLIRATPEQRTKAAILATMQSGGTGDE